MNVTVGICAYNEAGNIGLLLNNLLFEQKLSDKSEILAVCSGCIDNTVSIVQEYARRDHRVRLLVEKERMGKASAINRIFSNAKTENIVFVSADTMPEKDCINTLAKKMQKSHVGLVCARSAPINNSKSLADRMVQVLWNLHDEVFKQLSDKGLAKHASEVYCIRKGIVESIPVETVNDDAYIALVTRKKGWLVGYEPKSPAYIRGPETLIDYFRQRRRVIFGHYQVKKMTGESPQYFTALFTSWVGLKKVASSVIIRRKILTIPPFIMMEAISNLAAISDIILKKSHSKWRVAATTKAAILPRPQFVARQTSAPPQRATSIK